MKVEYETMNLLLNSFFEFRDKQDYQREDLTPYNIFGDFALYIQEGLSNNTLAEAEIDRAFLFFNKLAESENQYVLNLLVVGIFEIFSDDNATINLARKKLNFKAKKLFERTLKGWNEI